MLPDRSQYFPLPLPLSLPLEDLPPLPPGLPTRRTCGIGWTYEPAAVAPEPSSPGGELGSVGAGSVDPRAWLACCLAFRLLLECVRVTAHCLRSPTSVLVRENPDEKRSMRVVIPVVQEIVGRGGIQQPLGDTDFVLHLTRRKRRPRIIRRLRPSDPTLGKCSG